MKELSIKKVDLSEIEAVEESATPILLGAVCGIACGGAVCGGICGGVGCAGL